ncbi:replication protein A 32 kDa subunit [Pelomyxa schiedti]|nr:replication protein A 32 kDa subunit [Pelomyxa schiedti]
MYTSQSTTAYGGGGGYTNSPGVDSPKKGGAKNAGVSVIPVTLKLLLEATKDFSEETFKIDGKEVNQVTFVGMITKVWEQEHSIHYMFHDCTAEMEVVLWLDSQEGMNLGDGEASQKFAVGTYVRVYGALRSFADRRTLTSYRMYALTSMNELTHHMLEALFVHLHNQRGPIPGQPMDNFNQQGTAAPGGNQGQGDITEQVKNVLRQNQGENGLTVDEIVGFIPHFTWEDVNAVVQFLQSESTIYPGSDESHWKIIDGI